MAIDTTQTKKIKTRLPYCTLCGVPTSSKENKQKKREKGVRSGTEQLRCSYQIMEAPVDELCS